MYVLFSRKMQPFFNADPGAAESGTATAGAEDKSEGTPLSAEEVARQVTEAREAAKAEAKADYEKQLAEKLEESKTEAEKLAKMNAEQKADYERQQREDALAKREAEITARELRAEASKTLAEKGLSVDLLDLVIGTDAEDTSKRIDTFKASFDKAVQASVEQRLQGKTPISGNGAAATQEEQARSAFASGLKGGRN